MWRFVFGIFFEVFAKKFQQISEFATKNCKIPHKKEDDFQNEFWDYPF
jgi:hypothetical protein